jgi:hypothetical protein
VYNAATDVRSRRAQVKLAAQTLLLQYVAKSLHCKRIGTTQNSVTHITRNVIREKKARQTTMTQKCHNDFVFSGTIAAFQRFLISQLFRRSLIDKKEYKLYS